MWQPAVLLHTVLGDAASHSLSEAKLFQHRCRLQNSSMTPKPTLFLLECMHSYVPELTQRSVFSFSKMSQFSLQWHDPEGVSSGCLAQLFKHSARPKLTQQIMLLLLRCWERFGWVNKKTRNNSFSVSASIFILRCMKGSYYLWVSAFCPKCLFFFSSVLCFWNTNSHRMRRFKFANVMKYNWEVIFNVNTLDSSSKKHIS